MPNLERLGLPLYLLIDNTGKRRAHTGLRSAENPPIIKTKAGIRLLAETEKIQCIVMIDLKILQL